MKIIEKVFSTTKNIKPIEICGNTVHIRSDIHISNSNEFGEYAETPIYTYTETQYTKDEFIVLLSEKNTYLEEQLINTQLALCEVYENHSQPSPTPNNTVKGE